MVIKPTCQASTLSLSYTSPAYIFINLPWQVSNSQRSACLSLWHAGIKGIYLNTWAVPSPFKSKDFFFLHKTKRGGGYPVFFRWKKRHLIITFLTQLRFCPFWCLSVYSRHNSMSQTRRWGCGTPAKQLVALGRSWHPRAQVIVAESLSTNSASRAECENTCTEESEGEEELYF